MRKTLILLLTLIPGIAATASPTLVLSSINQNAIRCSYTYELEMPTVLPAGTTVAIVPLSGIVEASAAPRWEVSRQEVGLVEWTLVRESTVVLARYFRVVVEGISEPGPVVVLVDGVEVGTVVGPAMFY